MGVYILASRGILNLVMSSSTRAWSWKEGLDSAKLGSLEMPKSDSMPFLHMAREMVTNVALLEIVDRFPLTNCSKETKTRERERAQEEGEQEKLTTVKPNLHTCLHYRDIPVWFFLIIFSHK